MKHTIHLLDFTGPPVRITPALIAAANLGMSHVVVARNHPSTHEFEAPFRNEIDAQAFCDYRNYQVGKWDAYTVEVI